jgi:tetratricopeptide (TPR) repeat protein
MQGNPKAAATNYEEALRLKPGWGDALNDLAWLRATSPEPEVRDGAEAVRLAERACKLEGGEQARFRGTLGAAYAEMGRFPEAVKTAEMAITLATRSGQNELAAKNRELLERYQAGKAYREPAAKSR